MREKSWNSLYCFLFSVNTSLFSVFTDPRETRRIDTYLAGIFPHVSRSYIQKMIEERCITCNGKSFDKNKKIYRGDVIKIHWRVEKMHIEAENIPLDIVYENEDFAIVNKDAGVNTHPTPGEHGKTGTLVNALLYHFGSLSIINGVERPGIVHRLDKDTSGLIIIAKNDRSMHALQQKIAKRTIKKTYLALVLGIVHDEKGSIESYLGRDPRDRMKMTAKNPLNPKFAKTEFIKMSVIDEKYTLLEVNLLTGRTHQIRVHLASIGFPILGDTVYGNLKANHEAEKKYSLRRQWLHAWKLRFTLFGEEYSFEGKLKSDLTPFLKK